MHLKTYLDSLPRGGAAALAGEVGISTVYLYQLAVRQGDREPSPELSVRIERATAEKVTRRDLRPNDWQAIWPELVRPADSAWDGQDRRKEARA